MRNLIRDHPQLRRGRSPTDLEGALTHVISQLAILLVSTGYGFARVNRLTKIAYVEAARSIETKSGGKLNMARIAALTGLTRTDVSQILRDTRASKRLESEPINRAIRVANGWTKDKRFRSRDGSPKPLQFDGGAASYTRLVKYYSGDIPPRAMLSEMERLGLVELGPGKSIVLVRTQIGGSKRAVSALLAAREWLQCLAAPAAERNSELVSRTRQVELRFSSLAEVLAAIRDIEERHLTFVLGLEQLGNRRNSPNDYELKVSVAFATDQPRRSSRGSTPRARRAS